MYLELDKTKGTLFLVTRSTGANNGAKASQQRAQVVLQLGVTERARQTMTIQSLFSALRACGPAYLATKRHRSMVVPRCQGVGATTAISAAGLVVAGREEKMSSATGSAINQSSLLITGPG